MAKPNARFVGKVFREKKDPNGERRIVSFDRYEKRDDGTYRTIRCTGLMYEDGSTRSIPDGPLFIRPHRGKKGTQAENIYFMEFDDTPTEPEEFKDDEIPF